MLVFTLSRQRCALPLSRVERVVRAVEISPLPKAPSIVMGLINVCGQAVPVLSVRRLLGLPEAEMGLDDQMLIARTSRRRVAILVDDAEGVAGLEDGDMTPSEELFPGIECLEGVVKLKGGIVYIYDLDKFLSLDEEAAMDRLLVLYPGQPDAGGHDA